ncbi:uncharacterized protein LOC133483882 isoform X1 [Phyllopteryx taeniolatus]|uniref:uncharacterized protein LOC133483882 isoform X1 n=1 Tax=Phyllopteryx taeniolatus TaxID=161469 RepID=UPI002AD242AA|nr:uncharacterized protein LOC133483882 isoform X1 [Phyllopteryx taeniolatus]
MFRCASLSRQSVCIKFPVFFQPSLSSLSYISSSCLSCSPALGSTCVFDCTPPQQIHHSKHDRLKRAYRDSPGGTPHQPACHRAARYHPQPADQANAHLSVTSLSIKSISRARGGSGRIREAHSLAPRERVESAPTPETRSETGRPPVRPGEAATSETSRLEMKARSVLGMAKVQLMMCPSLAECSCARVLSFSCSVFTRCARWSVWRGNAAEARKRIVRLP